MTSEEERTSDLKFPSCNECAWKNEQLSGISPCEYCFRNPEIVSKRWKGPKTLCIKGIQMSVPRDMYISEEMLDFFKIMLDSLSKENEMLQAMLLRKTKRNIPIYEPVWEAKWVVTTYDNKVYESKWESWSK